MLVKQNRVFMCVNTRKDSKTLTMIIRTFISRTNRIL